MFGVVPQRFRPADGQPTLDTLFAMARGVTHSCCGGGQAQEMTKWFDTHYHYLVPEFTVDQQFQLSWSQLFEEAKEEIGREACRERVGRSEEIWVGAGT